MTVPGRFRFSDHGAQKRMLNTRAKAAGGYLKCCAFNRCDSMADCQEETKKIFAELQQDDWGAVVAARR
jgi:hypothetical protein